MSQLYFIQANEILFDIKKQEDKNLVKNNLKYNLEEYEDGEPNYNLHVKVIDIDRTYVANDESYDYSEYMFLIKENTIIAGFRRRDGVIKDYCNNVEKYLNHKIKK